MSQESGVVGLNFHQSKEVLITDSNGSAYGVSRGAESASIGIIYFPPGIAIPTTLWAIAMLLDDILLRFGSFAFYRSTA